MKYNPNYKHDFSNDTVGGWAFHGYEGWRPVIAMPYFVGFTLRKARCGCGRVFKNVQEFEAHYLYKAIWEGESTVLPTIWQDLSQPPTPPTVQPLPN